MRIYHLSMFIFNVQQVRGMEFATHTEGYEFLKKQGIHVIGLFFGQDENVKAAKDIYGSSVARITDIGRLADTIGSLVQNEIQSIFR